LITKVKKKSYKSNRIPIVNKFKFSKVTIKSDNLEKFEIKKLHELYFNNLYQNNLQKTLQYFLFGLNTGLPFPDLKNLKFNQIVKKEVNNEIKEILIYDRIKTGNHVEIPLNEIALKLIPYENKKSDNDKIFKLFEVQTTNRYLKKILDFAGINKNISWHKLRHSSATIMFTSTEDMKATSKFLGHKSIRTTELYLKDNIESLCNAVNSLV